MFLEEFVIISFIIHISNVQGSSTASELIMPVPGIRMTYNEALDRCYNNSSLPFIPSSTEEWNLMIEGNDNSRFHEKKGGGTFGNMTFWVPATDEAVEGNLKWYNGTDASAAPIGWVSNEPLYENSSNNNCVIINTKQEGRQAQMAPCDSKSQAMICVKPTSNPESTDIYKDRTLWVSPIDETTISIINVSNEPNSRENCGFSSLPWILVYCLGITTCTFLVILISIFINLRRKKKNDSPITQGSSNELQELNVIQNHEQS